MSINLNAIKAGGQRWWRPNLFLNGNFADNIALCPDFSASNNWQKTERLPSMDINILEDYVYWKLVDDQNKLLHEEGNIASADKHGFVRLHPVGDFYINNAGELNLQPTILT